MASGTDRFKQHLIGQALAPDESGGFQATVTAFAAGVVTVSFQGGSFKYPYLPSYTPNVGDKVAMIRYGGNWLIIGAPVGFPA